MRTLTKPGLWLLGAMALASAGPASAALTGYMKIPDIKGESKRSSAPAPYRTFKLERVPITSHQSSTSASDDRHKQWIDVLSISTPIHKPGGGSAASGHEEEIDIHGISWATAQRPAASRMAVASPPKVLRSTGGPGRMKARIAWPGCTVNKSLPHVILGRNGGRELELQGVRVQRCTAEEVTFYYNRIEVKR